jgi:hypothetical protein
MPRWDYFSDIAMTKESEPDILTILHEAFPREPLVPDQILGPSRAATYFGGNEHARMFESHLSGKTWLTVNVDSLDRDHDILFYLPPTGFAFLLPALMLAATTRFEQFGRLAELLSTLLTRDHDKLADFELRISALNPKQRAAVAILLERLESLFAASWHSNPAQAALDSFWRSTK